MMLTELRPTRPWGIISYVVISLFQLSVSLPNEGILFVKKICIVSLILWTEFFSILCISQWLWHESSLANQCWHLFYFAHIK